MRGVGPIGAEAKGPETNWWGSLFIQWGERVWAELSSLIGGGDGRNGAESWPGRWKWEGGANLLPPRFNSSPVFFFMVCRVSSRRSIHPSKKGAHPKIKRERGGEVKEASRVAGCNTTAHTQSASQKRFPRLPCGYAPAGCCCPFVCVR